MGQVSITPPPLPHCTVAGYVATWNGTVWTCAAPTGGAGGGASTALDNLAAVAINTALIPGTAGGLTLGTAAKPWSDIYFAGTSGTPATMNFKLTGASTSGTRTITFPDASLDLSVTTQNRVLATGGAGAGAASLRALVALDIPDLSGTYSPLAGSSSLVTVGTVTTGSFPAANLSGTTLASGVTGSSLTSVGTLGSLTVTNAISGSVTGQAGSVSFPVMVPNAGRIQTDTTAGHTFSLAGYDTSNTPQYRNVLTVTAAAGVPTLSIPNLMAGKLYPTSDAATAIQINKADNSTPVLTVDTANLRLGVGTITAPATAVELAGASSNSSLKIGTFELQVGGANNVGIGDNTLWTTQQVYRGAGYAAVLQMYNGGFLFRTAPLSGGAGAATLTNRLTVSNTGLIGFGGSSGDANVSVVWPKGLTSMADATPVALATVTIPNAKHAASVRILVNGALGDGDSSSTAEYVASFSRIAGANALSVLSAAVTEAHTTGVTGNAVVTVTLGSVGGAVGAANTFVINCTVTRSAGAATNHTCTAQMTLLNTYATGVTIQ
jgi:hypothetical protein